MVKERFRLSVDLHRVAGTCSVVKLYLSLLAGYRPLHCGNMLAAAGIIIVKACEILKVRQVQLPILIEVHRVYAWLLCVDGVQKLLQILVVDDIVAVHISHSNQAWVGAGSILLLVVIIIKQHDLAGIPLDFNLLLIRLIPFCVYCQHVRPVRYIIGLEHSLSNLRHLSGLNGELTVLVHFCFLSEEFCQLRRLLCEMNLKWNLSLHREHRADLHDHIAAVRVLQRSVRRCLRQGFRLLFLSV